MLLLEFSHDSPTVDALSIFVLDDWRDAEEKRRMVLWNYNGIDHIVPVAVIHNMLSALTAWTESRPERWHEEAPSIICELWIEQCVAVSDYRSKQLRQQHPAASPRSRGTSD